MLKIKDQLKYFLQYYEKLSTFYRNELKDAPEGNLALSKNHGKNYLIWTRQTKGKYLRKGIHTDQQMIDSLARKAYVSKCLDRCNSNSAALRDLIETIDDLNPDEIINSLPEAYRLLPVESFFKCDNAMDLHAELLFPAQKNAHLSELLPLSPEVIKARCDTHRQWGEMVFDQEPKDPETHIHTTSRGERTRAKSELMILEQLYSYAIPSRKDYRQAGIVPWENLIVTYDRDGAANMQIIKSTILYHLLPRL